VRSRLDEHQPVEWRTPDRRAIHRDTCALRIDAHTKGSNVVPRLCEARFDVSFDVGVTVGRDVARAVGQVHRRISVLTEMKLHLP
jgi:hypothetical protein